MGELGLPELMVIFLVLLIVFGAKRIPEIGSSLGRAVREFKQGLAGESQAEENERRSTGSQDEEPFPEH